MMRRGRFRHQAGRLIENVENRAGAEDAITFAVTDFGQDATRLQCDDGTHHGVVGNAQPTLRLARGKEGIGADEVDELERDWNAARMSTARLLHEMESS